MIGLWLKSSLIKGVYVYVCVRASPVLSTWCWYLCWVLKLVDFLSSEFSTLFRIIFTPFPIQSLFLKKKMWLTAFLINLFSLNILFCRRKDIRREMNYSFWKENEINTIDSENIVLNWLFEGDNIYNKYLTHLKILCYLNGISLFVFISWFSKHATKVPFCTKKSTQEVKFIFLCY